MKNWLPDFDFLIFIVSNDSAVELNLSITKIQIRDLLNIKFDLRIKIYLNIIKEKIDKSDKHRKHLININKTEVKQK